MPEAADDAEAGQEEKKPEPHFPDVFAWMREWFLPVWEHTHEQAQVWCSQWWDHPEALNRFTALWHAWEALRLDGGTGVSIWWRDHADPHLPRLLDTMGPFQHCRTSHTPSEPRLHEVEPPASLIDEMAPTDDSPLAEAS